MNWLFIAYVICNGSKKGFIFYKQSNMQYNGTLKTFPNRLINIALKILRIITNYYRLYRIHSFIIRLIYSLDTFIKNYITA